MKMNYLLPNSFKKISGIIFLVTFLFMIFRSITNAEALHLQVNVFAIFFNEWFSKSEWFVWIKHDIIPELIGIIIILSGLAFAFSKEKTEDEMISKIRLESLVWATYINYAVLLFFIIFFYGTSFLSVMIYNMFTLLLFFIIRFNWMLYKNNKINSDEE